MLAPDFWTAKSGRDALVVDWDQTTAFKLGSAQIMAEYRKLAATLGLPARREGDVTGAFAGAAKVVEAAYEFPYLAHAAMEPMNCVVRLGPKSCDVWNGEQFQTVDQAAIARVVGLKPEQVSLHMLYAGGSFGRRANPNSDYLLEAAEIAKAIKGRVPVKLVWTREDDMQAGYYRPMNYHVLKAGLDAQGRIVAWHHRIVGQSILTGTAFESALVKGGIDVTSVEGASTLPYAIPHLSVELHSPKMGVPVQWWRSVGSSHTAFSTETFLDEIAHATGKDPVALRLELAKDHPRVMAVIRAAAEMAQWDKPRPSGRALGFAFSDYHDTLTAGVAEISLDRKTGRIRVHDYWLAADPGFAVHPENCHAQMESAVVYGLSAALTEELTVKGGAAGVGTNTTSSVVTAITTVIGCDTVYNVIYTNFYPT